MRDQTGATAIEYGLIVALVAVAILTALFGTRQSVADMFNDVMTQVAAALQGAGS